MVEIRMAGMLGPAGPGSCDTAGSSHGTLKKRSNWREAAMKKKEKLKTTKWDVVDYLKTDDDMADYLEAAMEDGHPAVITTAIGNIARAKGMTQVARKAGIGRVSLYKALSPDGNPEFATVLKVVRALGLRLHATTA